MEAKQEEARDSNSTLFDGLRFTKELDDREVSENDVELISYSYLLSAYLMLNGSKAAAMDRSTVYMNCKNIISHAVRTLPMAGSHYLVVFRLIHDLCKGEMSLTQDDISVLSKHVQWAPRKEAEKEDDQETTPTELVAPTPGQESVSVAGEEVAKLFNQLKSRKPMDLAAASSSSSATPSGHAYPQRKPMLAMIRKKLKAQKKSKFLKETALGGGTRKGRSLFGTSGERGTPQAWSVPAIGSDRELSASMLCRELVEELGVGATLVQFCRDLPVVRELSSCSNGDLSGFWLGVTGAEEGEVKIAPLIKKLQELRNAAEALSLVLHAPNLLPPLSTAFVSTLKEMLVACFRGASEAVVLCTGLPARRQDSTSAKETELNKEKEAPVADTVSETTTDAEKEGKEEVAVTSILELYGSLSSGSSQLPYTSTSARNLASLVVSFTVKSYQRVLCLPLSSSVHRNLRTLYIHHTFTSLRPILLPGRTAGKPGESGEAAGVPKPQGTARLSVPLAEMIIHAVEGVKSLCEDVTVVGGGGAEAGKGVESREEESLTMQNLDVCRTYSSWQCVQLVLDYLPLLHHLFSLIVATFKKIQNHVTSISSQVSSDEPAQQPIKPPEGGGEKHERLLKVSLLEKLSERLVAADKVAAGVDSKELEDDGETYSPSPVSTVSSSGELGGVYMLYSDGSHSEDEEQEGSDEVEEYENSPPFFMANLGRSFGVPPSAASAPPLPPRRVPAKELQTKVPPKQAGAAASGVDSKKRKPLLLLRLASSSLQCLYQGLVKNANLNKYVREKLNAEHVSSLALLVQNLDALMSNMGGASTKLGNPFCALLASISCELMELLQEMIVTGIISRRYLQGVLLNELGLTPKCWPLKIPPAVLSLLGSVLICRLGEGQVNGEREGRGSSSPAEDDSLAVSIWKGFLYSLEESACSDEDPDEDLDVVHLQLLLFVWHTFSYYIRSSLLTSCAHAVIKAAHAARSGVGVSPLINSRLLLVLDYMLYQFTYPPPDLTYQVKINLFQDFTILGSRPASRSVTTPTGTTSGSKKKIVCYSNEIQLKYCTVLSKPNTAATPSMSKEPGGPSNAFEEMGVSPRFYNVRKCSVPGENEKKEEGEGEATDGEVEVESEIDEQACRCLLSLTIPEGVDDVTKKGSGYSLFIDALLTLMSVGSDYSNGSKALCGRVLLACCAHQCFTLGMNLLGTLPPSYHTLLAMVEGEGLSVVNKKGACLLIHVLHLCMKFRIERMDTEDVMDTLLMSGYGPEESEEMMGRVISVMDSSEHFKDQAVLVLRELSESDASTQLPLVCIAAVDLLLCLITRSAYLDIGEEGESAEVLTSKESGEQYAKGSTLDKFEVTFCTQLGPVIIKVLYRLLSCSHLYVCPAQSGSENGEETPPQMREALETLLCLSGKNPLAPKERSSLASHLPAAIQERIKSWESALLLDSTLKKKLSVYGDIQIEPCLLRFLDCHLMAFAGSRTFDPSRGLKSAISAVLVVLEYMFGVFHEMEKEGEERKKEVTEAMVSLSCDVTMEFCQAQLLKFLLNNAEFASRCLHYKTARCLQALVIPEMKSCDIAGPILAFLFQLLTSLLLDSPEDDATLERIAVTTEPTGLNNLLLMTSLPSMSSEALTESLQFLIGALAQAERKTLVTSGKTFEPYALISRALLSMSEQQLKGWLARVVLGSSSDDSSSIKHNTGLFRKFVEILTKEDGLGDSPVCHTLLSGLLSLSPELCQIFTSKESHAHHQYSFRNCFDCLVLLASANKKDGHLQLARVVVEWLPLGTQAHQSQIESQAEKQKEAKMPAKEGKSGDNKNSKKSKDGSDSPAETDNDELANPLNTMYAYLSQVTTAVQYSSSKSDYVERRTLAAEDDVLFDDDEDGEDASVANEDEAAQEEGDEDVNSKTCTFKITHREFANQHWYHCHTCSLINHSGVCSVCAKVCHKGHDVTYSKFGSFFCDCGGKEDGNCKAMEKRQGEASGGPSQPPPFSDPPSSQGGRRKKRGKQRRSGKKSPAREDGDREASRGSKKEEKKKKKKKLSSPSQLVLRLAQSIEGYKSELIEFLVTSDLCKQSIGLLRSTMPRVVQALNSETSAGCNQARKAMQVLHQSDKKIEFTDGLMAATLGSQEGAFENVRLNFSENQGPMMRQLLQSHSIIRVAMCALTSIKGKRQHLCVNHDRGKLTILQLFPILKQADSNRRKLTLTRLSTTSVPFTVLSMTHNPCNEDLLVVCGLTECQMLVINSSGQVTSRSLLHPSVGSTGYIVKAIWVPGSKHELVLATDSFVKVFDTNVDVISPTFYFVLGDGKIKDATVAVTDEGKFVVVMTYAGKMYSQPLVDSVSANEGPVYFTVELKAQHSTIKTGSDNYVNGGGASVYYSQTLKMLFFSYFNGISCVATTNSNLSAVDKVFDIYLKSGSTPIIPGSKKQGPALISWMEVQHHPGLVCAVSKLTSNPVTLLIKPEVIQVHELKPLPNKAKVQGMVAMRQPPNIGDVALRRTTLIILCEDGSLRIYVANSTSSTEYWLQSKFQPTSPLAVLRSRPHGKGQLVTRKKEGLKFPIDYFEHCQMSNDIEFGGSDILHVYNKQQVINRLDKATLYIANTKPAGFTVEVTNLASGSVMVGTRVLLRSHSPEKSPSSVEVFGRTHMVNVLSGACRWIDIPFTREESIQAGKTFKINFGPSLDPSGVSFVDTIRVYVKSKEAFGWPENPPEPSSTKSARDGASPTDSVDQGSEVLPMVISKGCTAADNLACNLMTVLSNHFMTTTDKQEEVQQVQTVVPEGTSLLMHGVPSQLQFKFKLLLVSLVGDKQPYYHDRDNLQLRHVVDTLVGHAPQGGSLEPELFQYLLLILVSICKARPSNLLLLSGLVGDEVARKVLVEHEEGVHSTRDEETEKSSAPLSDLERMMGFIHLLNTHFWAILKKRPLNPAVSPVVNPGFAAVDQTVACMTEVMWSLVLLDHTLLDIVLRYTVKFLLAPDSHLCLCCSRVIMRLLKPKKAKQKEQVVVVERSHKDACLDVQSTATISKDEEMAEEDEDEEEDEEMERPTEETGGGGGGGGDDDGGDDDQPPDVSEEGPEIVEVESQPEGSAEEQQDQQAGEQAGGVHWNLLQMMGGAGAGAGGGMAAMLPEQLLAMGDMMPDEEAMMNLAIALSLGNEGEGAGGGQGAEQGLQAYLQNLMGGIVPQVHDEYGGGEEAEGGGASNQANEEDNSPRYGPPLPPSRPPDNVENIPPSSVHAEGEGELEHHSQSSSPSSIYSLPHEEDPRLMSQLEGVLREETATPSESRRERNGSGGSGHGKDRGESQTDGELVKGSKNTRDEEDEDLQNDVNSEPEMVNDSSAEEEELGEDEQTLIETLCRKLEQSRSAGTVDDEETAGLGAKTVQVNARLSELRILLLRQLVGKLDLLEEAGGMRAISFLQLLIFLTTNLECCKEDSLELTSCLRALLGRMSLLCEDGEPDHKALVQRSKQGEVFLLYFRFFNILMSRQKNKEEDTKAYNKHMQWFLTAKTLLTDSTIMQFSCQMLATIMEQPSCLELAGGSGTSSSFVNPLDNLSPFFQRHYVKGHVADIFSAYGRLMAEILLVLPCQLKKIGDVTSKLPSPEFGRVWEEILCDFLLKVSQNTGVGRRHVRKLLLQICGSKENYRYTRDLHSLKRYIGVITDTCQSAGFNPDKMVTAVPLNLGYKAMLGLIEQLRLCAEVVATRTNNWQIYCHKEKDTLPYLFHTLFVLDSGLAPLIIQLIHAALSGTPPVKVEEPTPEPETRLTRRKKDLEEALRAKEKEKAKQKESKVSVIVPNKELCRALVQLFLTFVDGSSLARFSELFLLQSNSSPLRWQAHRLLHTLYQYAGDAQRVSIVEMLWDMWPGMPNHGHKASQLVDLLGYLTISTPQVLEKESLCQLYVERAVSLLKKQNTALSSHPNAHIYSQLRSLVDFDGFYLESEPCLVCNDPEVQSSLMKLQSIKSEIRYTPNMILVKLVGSHSISQIQLRISDIKRTKMVRTVNVYYSNRTVQNVIELKNKRSMWLMAKTCNLTAGQNEVKVDFPLPIVASNIIIQFSDFYDNLQGGSEVLQCPRCQASVPAHPGVCNTCGENVYQCHKCRAINYDEKDPFLCNSCGFSKYAKFDTFVEGKSCSAVDPIESEEDRQKTMLSINQLLEKADKIYRQQVSHRNELDQLLVCLASGTTFHYRTRGPVGSDLGVNKGIQVVAQQYCVESKTIYAELSKIIQNVMASRRELVKYDTHKGEGLSSTSSGSPLLSPSPMAAHLGSVMSPPATPLLSGGGALPLHHQGRCYGCSSAATEHCITLLKALTFQTSTRRPLVREKLIRELVEVNLRSGSAQMQRDIRKLLCQLTRDDEKATAELNDLLYSRITERLNAPRIDPNLASLVRPEMLLLMVSLDMEDACWEQRLRTVFRLFKKSQSYDNSAVMAGITMPCLKIMNGLIYPKDIKKKNGRPIPLGNFSDQITVKVKDWVNESPAASFENWRAESREKVVEMTSKSKEEVRRYRLMEKYATRWKFQTNKVLQFRSCLRQVSWLRSMLFNPASQSSRRSTCNMIASLCQGEARHRQILDLLCGFLDDVGSAGEHAQEFLELLKLMTEDPNGQWKLYLSKRGILPKIGALITREIDYLKHLEESTLSSDLSQGYALKMLTALLQSFLSIDHIKQLFKGQMVGIVLNGYLSLKRLVVQRTKRVDESQDLLLEMLEDLTSGTEEEKQSFMKSCVETLNQFSDSDLITPIFVFERLCNIIHPEDNNVGEFFLSLEKDPQQEEFLQGRMQGNPYPSTSPGLGPLMRDVKNKICTDCELVALLEDDTGMELLVCNKIISLDLPVKDVYKKIWCAQQNHTDVMRVIYRMRGLLGDATEDIVEQLNDGKDKDTNEEEDYKMADIMGRCGGLDAMLARLSHIKDFVQGHALISAALRLLGYCVKLKANRQYLLRPELSTLNVLLRTLDLALHNEEHAGNGIGASVAESVLRVTERILQEASISQHVLVRTTSHEGSPMSPQEPDSDDNLQVFLRHIERGFVQSNPTLREGLMHIIPFLTFGVTKHMNVLLQHFAPYLNFEKFDNESSPENRLYLDCFCVVASGIGRDTSGEKMKDLAIEMNITPSAVDYLIQKVPEKLPFDTSEWKSFIAQPSVPYVLKMLTGLCHWHSKTQAALLPTVGKLHLLEQVASDQHIGTLAENLLEAMFENPQCQEEIKRVRRETRLEKKKKAMAMRTKELESFRMQVNEKGQVKVSLPCQLMKEMEEALVDEAGLKCCICMEGYRNQPKKVLGIYTYTRKVTLDEFENKPKKMKGYATVSHFNVVHYDCHSASISSARSRDEWESALLHNANTRCNGLLPIWGPEVTETNFNSCLSRHNTFLQECTGLYDHSHHMLIHDLRHLLLRFAYEKSFSAESGGGGAQSNLYLAPYIVHVAAYLININRREEKSLDNFLAAGRDKWVASAYELDGPQYCLVQSILLQTLSQWRATRLTFLRRLIVLAHSRSLSSTPIKSLPSTVPAEFSVYKPLLVMFGLVNGLHDILKSNLDDKAPDITTAVLEYIRNHDETLLEGCDTLVTLYQEDLLKLDSFVDFCKLTGLEDAASQGDFIAELLSSL